MENKSYLRYCVLKTLYQSLYRGSSLTTMFGILRKSYYVKFVLKWEAEDIVSKLRVSLEVNTKYFLI